jgi:ABC-type multidrug transport system fused ATPase/permease subunit
MKYTNKKTIFQRIWSYLEDVWYLLMLPKSVQKFHNYPLTRIFRVIGYISIHIGGICIITFLFTKCLLFSYSFNFIILFIALLHFIYNSIISFIKLFYAIRYLRINSPTATAKRIREYINNNNKLKKKNKKLKKKNKKFYVYKKTK